jgi:hypothetical protein
VIVEDEGFWKHWAHRLFGPHPGEPPPPPTREELVGALAACDRQLEILRQGPVRSGDFRPAIAELEPLRAGLAQALAELEPASDSLSSPSPAIDRAP